MPDRYGDKDSNKNLADFADRISGPPPGADALQRQAERILRGADIDRCTLCNTDGYRGATVCDHTNHAEAAARGMKLIRATMGWKTPQNPAESQPGAKNTPP